jgi:predicted phosphoadenosine phosphosulfate sulfurtransferase
MITCNCKTLKEFEDFGLLAELPENRKEMAVRSFNIAIKWVTDHSLVITDDRMGEIEVIILPLFYRIAKVVDLTEVQVLETCKEFCHSWLNADMTRYVKLVDPEAAFIKTFAEMKINQYKTK